MYDLENDDISKKGTKKVIKKELLIHQLMNIDLLTTKFLESQKDKVYMLYDINTHNFIIDKINDDELKLLSKYKVIKNNIGFVNKIIYETISGKTTIHMLLRWKNHAGILNPAFQISIKRTI